MSHEDQTAQELLEDIAAMLVDHPDRIQVKTAETDHCVILELHTHPDDIGKVIGKGGAMASAIRTILGAISGKHKRRYTLEVMEKDGLHRRDHDRQGRG